MRIIDSELGSRLTNASFVAACLVVLLHSPNPVMNSAMSVVAVRFVRFGVCEIAVPYFFIASGFLLVGKYFSGSYLVAWRNACCSRVRSLLIPYLIFCVIALLLKGVTTGSLLPSLSFKGVMTAFGLNIMEFPAYKLLWFIRNLYLLVVVSPLLAFLITRSRTSAWILVLLTLLIYGMFELFSDLGLMSDWARIFFGAGAFRLRSLFYFVAGMTLRVWCNDLHVGRLAGWLAGWLSCFLGVALLQFAAGLSYGSIVVIVAHICLIVWMWSVVRNLSLPRWLTRNAFAVYLIHGVLLYGVRFVADKFEFSSMLTSVGGWFLSSLIVLSFSLLMAEMLRWISPRIAAVMFGGR